MKLKLDNDMLAEEFFENSHLLGIVAPVKDYFFTWQINQKLGFHFRLNNDCEIQLVKRNRQYFFPVYSYAIPASSITHYIYNNQHDGEYLLPEFKHLDFLWLIKGEQGEEVSNKDVSLIQQMIKQLSFVQLVNEMTNEKIKNKTHLVF